MRLQLRSVILAISVCYPATAAAQAERLGSASVAVYADDDHMTVVSPSAGAQATVNESLSVDANFTADVISGASVDVISEASPSPIEETRLEFGAGLQWRTTSTVALRFRAIGSSENDWDSVRLNAGAQLELAQRNTTLDASYVFGRDWIGTVNDLDFGEDKQSHRMAITLTQIVDSRTLVDLVAEFQLSRGYHSNPYRTIPLADEVDNQFMRIDEQTPDQRAGGTGLVRVRRALSDRWIAAGHYRFYADEWSVTSHTAQATLIHELTSALQLGALVRAYSQSGADFYKPHYAMINGVLPSLRTKERRLGEMTTLSGRITTEIAIGGDVESATAHLLLAAGAMRFSFPEFPAQTRRTATTANVSLRVDL